MGRSVYWGSVADGNRRCGCCHQEKPENQFREDKKEFFNGFDDWCIECRSIRWGNNKETKEDHKKRQTKQPYRAAVNKHGKLPHVKLRLSRRARMKEIRKILKEGGKDVSPIRGLGMTSLVFEKYIYDQCEPWMTNENYGLTDGWVVDHIYPLSRINWCDQEEAAMAVYYTNQRPLSRKENTLKSNKILPNYTKEIALEVYREAVYREAMEENANRPNQR